MKTLKDILASAVDKFSFGDVQHSASERYQDQIGLDYRKCLTKALNIGTKLNKKEMHRCSDRYIRHVNILDERSVLSTNSQVFR